LIAVTANSSPRQRLNEFIVKDAFGSRNIAQNIEEILAHERKMEEQFENLDQSMQKVLDQHEYEFMQAYNIYVKKKEKELLDMIHELENRNKNNNLLDIKIKNLESTVLKLRKETEANEKTKESLR
jgi:chromosome segregation ATPase